MRGRVAGLERAPQRDRVGRAVAGQPAGQVHLVAVARLDVLDDRPDAGLELGPVEARGPGPEPGAGARYRRGSGGVERGLEVTPARRPARETRTAPVAPVDLRVRRKPDEAQVGDGIAGRPTGSAGPHPLDAARRGRRRGIRPTSRARADPAGRRRRRPSTGTISSAPQATTARDPSSPTAAGSSRGNAARIGPTSIRCRVPGRAEAPAPADFSEAFQYDHGTVVASLPPWRAFVRRYVIALGVTFVLVTGALVVGNRVIDDKLSDIPRIGGLELPEGPGKAGNFLIIGSDSRSRPEQREGVRHRGRDRARRSPTR